ncbi:MAG: 30S ribosomal protein S6 [Clostridia bacterium]|nr:30S ribosomal protein S6 [Clostridia bacterium]
MENTAYECMIVVDAKLNETKREELIGRFKKMAGDQTTVEKMGQKKYGFYYLLNFRATSDVPAKMTALMNITEGVDRYLFIAKTDVMLAQDVIRKQNRAKAREEYLAKKELREKESKEIKEGE